MGVKIIRRFPSIDNSGFDFSKWNRQFLNNNVILNGMYSSYYYPTHWTPLSIKCAFGGSEYYITPGIKYGVNDRSYLILNDGTLYESLLDSGKKIESFTINFQKDFAEDILYSLANSKESLLDHPRSTSHLTTGFFEKLYDHDNITISIFNRIRTLINQQVYDELAINQLLHFLLEHMFRIQNTSLRSAKELKAARLSTRIELYKRLSRAKDYMTSNYSESVDLKILSKTACLSTHHFLRSFKEAFGESPHRYLTRVRIDASKEMLVMSDTPVTEICNSVGFESLSSFGVLFKRFYGFSPENYRLSHKKAIFKQ